jgi:hypothetical protein
LNVTMPVGVPPYCPETVAVNVTIWPMTEGLTDDVTAVKVVALDTLCDTTVEVLPVKLASPA